MNAMNRSSLVALHTYNVYANNLVLETAAAMTPEAPLASSSPSHGSVFKLLQHIFGCEYYFTMECMNCEPDPAEESRAGASLAALSDRFSVLNTAREHYLEKVNEYELEEEITVNLGRGEFTLPRWQFMAQSLLHSIHHRGELSIVMTSLGHPLPTLDPILLYIQQAGRLWD